MHIRLSIVLFIRSSNINWENKEISNSHVTGKGEKIIQDNLEISSKLTLEEEQERANITTKPT
jgi:hypothetical protein